MKHPTRTFRQLLDRAQGRFVRSRPGSVLILVVALLVLMALIGTAYMTMAQFDRATAVQHSFNTEVDLVLEGMINQVKGVVTGDVFYNGQFRPGTNTVNPSYNTPGSTYNYVNGVGPTLAAAAQVLPLQPNPGDWWIASRVPDPIGFLSNPQTVTATPTWNFISGPVAGGVFNSPNTATTFTNRALMTPVQTSAQIDGQFWPAFSNVNSAFIMADTDGDGIADACFVKLLTLDGITYYGACRIVDNCAAINASIATRPNPNYALVHVAGTPLPGDYSPVSLDLEGMIPNALGDLYGTGVGTAPGLQGYRYNYATPSTTPMNDTGAVRADFLYAAYNVGGSVPYLSYEQLWWQLGRRLDNPGYIGAGATKFQALPISESMTMAKGFVLRDATIAAATNSTSMLEQKLPSATFTLAQSTPYLPNAAANWFAQNFNYAAGANSTMPVRALLVSSNPVSNFAPGKFPDKGLSGGIGAYNFGDMITYTGDSHRYVCINSNPTGAPIIPSLDPNPFSDPNWAFEPWSTAATKTNVNTASFQQLYAAYWAVMADQYTAATGQWQPPYPNATDVTGRMFRNPVRGPAATTVLTSQQVMYLRAALAAVNTLDLRDSDDDVTSRTITIPGTAFKATVYGSEKQPYITQVYARNDTNLANDWVGIEIHNPFTTAIPLNNWLLASLKRTSLGVAANPWTPVSTFAAAVPTITSIPAGGRIVLLSNLTPTNATLPAPFPVGVQVSVVANLTKALGQELFIMRPRSARNVVTQNPYVSGPATNDIFIESATNFNDLVPVDSYDFTNLLPTATSTATMQEWTYFRPSGAGKYWHHVYPGPWNAAALVSTATAPTLGGTHVVMPIAAATKTVASTLGAPQATTKTPSVLTYQDVPLQIANVDFAGPLKATTATNNFFPLGGFVRNADMLTVPYIGAYKIWSGATDAAQMPLEFNTVSMDSAMATAIDVSPFTPIGTSALATENIGRFCPIDKNDAPKTYDDFNSNSAVWMNHWAMRLFDYLTVLGPQDDYLPEVDPWQGEPSSPPGAHRYLPADSGSVPLAVANSNATVTNAMNNFRVYNKYGATEETAPVNGLVNINTAPWRTLAAVPWIPASAPNGAVYQAGNAAIAKAIVRYRDVTDGSGKPHGPFKNIFELNDVPIPAIATVPAIAAGPLRNAMSGLAAAANMTPQFGYLQPLTFTPATQVVGDFESQFQALVRVSNLITTRSDSYTAYILVQGWRDAETGAPYLVVQRRAAVIIDRSSVTPTNPTPSVTNVPVD